jgi:hypothetical protein
MVRVLLNVLVGGVAIFLGGSQLASGLLLGSPSVAELEDFGDAIRENDTKLMATFLEKHGSEFAARVIPGDRFAKRPPLFVAAMRGSVDAAKLLLSHGADVNVKFQGFSPLMCAAVNGKKDFVQLLLQEEKVNIGDKVAIERPRYAEKGYDHKTAEDLAREKGHNEIVNLIKRGHQPSQLAHQQGDIDSPQDNAKKSTTPTTTPSVETSADASKPTMPESKIIEHRDGTAQLKLANGGFIRVVRERTLEGRMRDQGIQEKYWMTEVARCCDFSGTTAKRFDHLGNPVDSWGRPIEA